MQLNRDMLYEEMLIFVIISVGLTSEEYLGIGTGPTDHWPVAENEKSCKLQNCALEMV